MRTRPGLILCCVCFAACESNGESSSTGSERDPAPTDEVRQVTPEPEARPASEISPQITPDLPRETREARTDSFPVSSAPDAGPFQVGGDVERPQRLAGEMLIEPLREMMRSGEYAWGACIFTVTISDTGEVDDVRFLKPEDLAPEVRQAITEAAAGWRFSPATRAGKPVPVYYNLVIHHCPYQRIRSAED